MSEHRSTHRTKGLANGAPNLRCWLADVLGLAEQDITIDQIAGDASPRRYFRVALRVSATDQGTSRPALMPREAASTSEAAKLLQTGTLIGVSSPPSENNESFLAVQQILHKAGLRVPEQYINDLERGLFLMEDFGETLLSSQLTAGTVDACYSEALGELIRLAGIPISSVALPILDESRIRDELSVFPEWFLRTHLGLSESEIPVGLWTELAGYVTTVFARQTQCVVHRDFHSRNIMCLEDHRMGIIDFQDAVLGPITYDPVSLLKDCYIRWPRENQLHWLECHRERLIDHGVPLPDTATFIRDFDLVGLQRHLRVLGVFARLCMRDKKPDYLNDLPLVLLYVREALELYRSESPIAAFSEWFEAEVMPRVEDKEWYRQYA